MLMFNATSQNFFLWSLKCLPLHEQSYWYTPRWLIGTSFGLFLYRMLCKLSDVKAMSLLTFLFFANFWSNIRYPRDFLWVGVIATVIVFLFGIFYECSLTSILDKNVYWKLLVPWWIFLNILCGLDVGNL